MHLELDLERRHTTLAVLRAMEADTRVRLERQAVAQRAEIASRLDALDREWDTDRAIELEAAVTGLAGLALGARAQQAFLALPAVAAAGMLLHATTGRYPLLPLLRRAGVRTGREIARERYALKALRGDFNGVGHRDGPPEPDAGIHVGGDEAGVVSQVDASTARETPERSAKGGAVSHAHAFLPATARRVEQSTSGRWNAAIRERTDCHVQRMERADARERDARLVDLGREWDVERVLQANAATLVLTGIALALRLDRRFLLLPAAVWTFLAQHALQGWCPPLPILRRLGVRTRREIERERYAVKAMRGDFEPLEAVAAAEASARVHVVLAAVDA